MGEFEEMARAAALAKAAELREQAARQEEFLRGAREQAQADEQAVNEHVLPVLRQVKRDLDQEGTDCTANFNRAPPTYAVSLVIGHRNTAAVAHRQSELSVEREAGRFLITVTSENAPPATWRPGPEDFRTIFKEAFQDALKRWHGLSPYR